MAISTTALTILATALVSAVGTNAQATEIWTCKNASCTGSSDNCYVAFPEGSNGVCLQFEKSEFDNAGFPLNANGGYDVYFDIPQPELGCRHVIYSGSSVNNCGITAGSFTQATCARISVNSRMAMMYDCTDGTSRAVTPKVATIPKRHEVEKRDCSTFNLRTGPYIKSGGMLTVSDPVSGPASVAISESITVGRSQTFSASVGDPYGIISLSSGVEFSESTTNQLSYTFEVQDGQNGYVGWSPQLNCVEGVLSGCDGAADESGEVCGPNVGADGEVIGQYSFVLSSRTAKEAEKKVARAFEY
ncbi:hypothetical protein BJY00DRAFT_314566 [Aspergillus carlsbadensis]|nr:hypothetical protein BJY00DRAFT_314566 [Aspergillus carlsbadensis]